MIQQSTMNGSHMNFNDIAKPERPLFKDLSYYNGSVEVWKYLESIRGDDLQLSLLLAGKIDVSKEHQRVILESHSL